MMTSKLHIDLAQVARGEDDKFALYVACVLFRAGLDLTNHELYRAFARIENHYFVNEVIPSGQWMNSINPDYRDLCEMDNCSRSKRSTRCKNGGFFTFSLYC